MIQIDGLSHRQLDQAIKQKRMPFLSRLIKHERYILHTHYSGMPSSTPGVQGELFYGVHCAVPAFSFRDRKSGRIVRMFDHTPALEVENQLKKKGRALLKGGSAYSNIFTGGADEPHFCMSSMGPGDLLKAANPFAVAFLIFSNAYSFLRVFILLLVELVLALYDCVSGLINGHNFIKELKFVSTRVGICILMRELIVIGAKLDMARGLPVVHINFIGYDEQAHRRGPSSLFAHWALKGIDDSVARIWKTAKRSSRRAYDVWIYSDHGQEETLSYYNEFGRTVEEAVASVFADTAVGCEKSGGKNGVRGIQSQRVRLLGGKRIQKIFPVLRIFNDNMEDSPLRMASMGPVALVYVSYPLDGLERERLGRELVATAHIPLVFTKIRPDRLRAWTREGGFDFPEQNKEILGEGHPFLDEVSRDLVKLCGHPDAGDFVLCGWRPGKRSFTFPIENGSHGGPGFEETRAFALLPVDTCLPDNSRGYLRPDDLRRAAFNVLNGPGGMLNYLPERINGKRHSLRLMTYNVHSCMGMDGKLSPERIARVIAQHEPDIVALQEIDVGKSRSGRLDQAHVIAKYLRMDFHFHPTLNIKEELYGDAILSHLPMRLVKTGRLPGVNLQPRLEPRGAIWVEIDFNGIKLQCINTHLGLLFNERRAQVKALLGADWLSHPECQWPVVLCGDFNSLPNSSICRKLRERLTDVQIDLTSHIPKKTFFGRFPVARIDHVFVDRKVEVLNIEVPADELARVASDHLPLFVEMRFS